MMKKLFRIRLHSIVLALIALAVAASTPLSTIYAADDQNCDSTIDYQYYRTNRILWDDECKTVTGCVTAATTGTVGGVKAASLDDLEKSDTLQQIFQDLLNGGMNAVQAAAVMGNMYVESGRTFAPDTYEGGVDTPASGYGIVQWTNNRPDYTTGRRINLEAYARQQGTPKSNLDLQIKFLFKEYNESYKAQMADGAFGKGTNVTDATKNWMRVFERPAEKGSDPALLYSERIPAANKIYGFYSDLTATTPAPAADGADAGTAADATADGDATAATCDGDTDTGAGTSDSVVAGSIVQTALGYAWPTPVKNGTNQMSDATKAYQQDKPKYAPEGLPSDCGAFVSTVMQASGVDPDFPHFLVHIQGAYVKAHPDKYKIIENATASDAQPGDILILNNYDHIEISKGGRTTIDASNTMRVPSVRPTGIGWISSPAQGGFFIARYIGANGDNQ